FEGMLNEQGTTLAEYREHKKEELLPKVLQDSFVKNTKVKEDDLLKTYDEFKIRQIQISMARIPEAQARTKAEKVLAEVKSGKDFAELANKYSDDPNNKPTKFDPKQNKMVDSGPPKGGDMGWMPLMGQPDEYADAVYALKKGETSGLVKTPMGFYIIRLE